MVWLHMIKIGHIGYQQQRSALIDNSIDNEVPFTEQAEWLRVYFKLKEKGPK